MNDYSVNYIIQDYLPYNLSKYVRRDDFCDMMRMRVFDDLTKFILQLHRKNIAWGKIDIDNVLFDSEGNTKFTSFSGGFVHGKCGHQVSSYYTINPFKAKSVDEYK